jgi:hypothetical protein
VHVGHVLKILLVSQRGAGKEGLLTIFLALLRCLLDAILESDKQVQFRQAAAALLSSQDHDARCSCSASERKRYAPPIPHT